MTNDQHGTVLDAKDRAGNCLRVTFAWHRDRYAHTIGIVDGEQLMPLFASREGSDEDNWPPSPPLQQLNVEERPDGSRVALLIGMAGKSHWSASVEAPAGRAEVIFDVACRVKGDDASLASAYRAMLPVRAVDDRALTVPLDGGACSATASDDAASNTSLAIDHEGFAVIPVGSDTAADTIRWRYVVSLSMG